jgi:hypothetical protein
MSKTPDSSSPSFRTLVQLPEDLCGQQIKDFADHLLNVARCSSDRVALAASRECNGYGVSRTKLDNGRVFKLLKTIFGCTEMPSSKAKGKPRQRRGSCLDKIILAYSDAIPAVRISMWLVRRPSRLECACVYQALYRITEHCKARRGYSIGSKLCLGQYNALPELMHIRFTKRRLGSSKIPSGLHNN